MHRLASESGKIPPGMYRDRLLRRLIDESHKILPGVYREQASAQIGRRATQDDVGLDK